MKPKHETSRAEIEIETSGASFHLANCGIQDAHWFGELCRLFADPHESSDLKSFREGRLMLGRNPKTGGLVKLAVITNLFVQN